MKTKRTLGISIECGETTCSSSFNNFCDYLGTRRFGTIWMCTLFDKELKEEDQFLLRCEECLKMEKKEVS